MKQEGISVFVLNEECDVEGIESLSDKIQQAGDQPLLLQLRANVNIKSPALYIYTSGTTGNLTGLSDLHFLGDRKTTIKIFCICSLWRYYLLGLPKAAVITHERVWLTSFFQTVAGVRSDDIIYVNLPLYHSSAFMIGICGAIEKGQA